MAITINTSKYMGEKRVVIDGNDWKVTLPGAGEELRMSQAQRRIKLLDKKIEDGSATEADYDLYDKLEADMLQRFVDMFNDGSKDNKTVKDWVNNTPFAIIAASFEEVKKQSEENGAEQPDNGQQTS